MNDILDLPKGSDSPTEDQATVLKAQILLWLIGATDGHAEIFSRVVNRISMIGSSIAPARTTDVMSRGSSSPRTTSWASSGFTV